MSMIDASSSTALFDTIMVVGVICLVVIAISATFDLIRKIFIKRKDEKLALTKEEINGKIKTLEAEIRTKQAILKDASVDAKPYIQEAIDKLQVELNALKSPINKKKVK